MPHARSDRGCLVAGASGLLGRELVAALKGRGARVTALARDAGRLARYAADADQRVALDVMRNPRDVAAACEGVGVVYSCLGASVMPLRGRGWRAYTDLDVRANSHLIDAARRAGAAKFVYVAAASHDAFRDTAYVRAHEEVAAGLARSGMPYAIVRATGFFGSFAVLLDLAARGRLALIGDGSARTNPIHEADLATVCADAADSATQEITVGGPEILSRREIADLAFGAVGKTPKYRRVAPGVVRFIGRLARPFHPRFAQLVEFVAAISVRDVIAPAVGTRTLAEDFAARVGRAPQALPDGPQ